MKGLIIFFIILFSASLISAICEEGQINLNTASLEELDELYGIGEVKAQAIIDGRPFSSVDDLIDVYGIGEITLNKIKEQDLACIEGETEEVEEEESEEVIEEVHEEKPAEEKEEIKQEEDKEIGIINLTAQVIKSQDNKEDKSKYAVYGFAAFCVLLGILFMLKLKNREYKNEFR